MLRDGFAALSWTWMAALPVAAWSASSGPRALAWMATATVYTIGALVCHQLPQRSFHAWGAQFPVCARCTGIYLGAALASLWIVAGGRGSPLRSSGAAWWDPKSVAALAAAPTIATLVFEWTTGITPSNLVRFVAGLPIGVVAAWLVMVAGFQRVTR